LRFQADPVAAAVANDVALWSVLSFVAGVKEAA
jgi:hypothetical protein